MWMKINTPKNDIKNIYFVNNTFLYETKNDF